MPRTAEPKLEFSLPSIAGLYTLIPLLKLCPYPSSALGKLDCRPLAKDGMNRSFAAVYDGQHSPHAAKDAADRLHLILQREDAVVAKSSGTTFHIVALNHINMITE